MAQDENGAPHNRVSLGAVDFDDERSVSSSAVALVSPKWPRKSILKHSETENATVPLTQKSREALEPNSVRSLDRRVSFAEKVQLHQIEVSPYLGENLSSSHHSSSDVDDGSSDIDTSFSALEADADKVLTMLEANEGKSASEKDVEITKVTEHVPSAFSPSAEYENTDEDSENSMELTEPLRAAAASEMAPAESEPPVISGSSIVEEKLEATEAPNSETLPHGKENEPEISPNDPAEGNSNFSHIDYVSELGANSPEQDFPYTHQDFGLHHVEDLKVQEHGSNYAPSLTSSEDYIEGEEEMEFTSQVSRFNYEELTMEMTLPQASDVASLSTRSAGFENAIGVFESTTDSTNNGKHSHASDQTDDKQEDEATMELTKQVGEVHASPQKPSEELTMELTQQVNEKPLQNSQEIIMDITKQVDNEIDHQDAEEVTMDITKVVETDISNQIVEKTSEHTANTSDEVSDEETAMELTQPVKPHSESENKETPLDEGPIASSTQSNENTSPVFAGIAAKKPEQNNATVSEEQFEEMQQNKRPRDADLSTIHEEESEVESRGNTKFEDMIENAETVQTPTNFDLEESEAVSLPNVNLNQADTGLSNQMSRNSSTSSSNEDVNIYDDDSPDEASVGKHALGPAMNPSPTKRHKPSKDETTEISKQNIPEEILYNDEWDVPDISLPDFLQEIGVKYYDDLEIATNVYQPSSRSSAENYSSEQYYKANIQLPLLEVYDLSCKELAEKIQQGKVLFDEIKEKSLQNNPVLFKRYLSASSYEKGLMETKFLLMKEYTKQQAKEVWYEWRKKLLGNIVEVYQKDLEMLRDDRSILESNLESMEQAFKIVNRDLSNWRSKLERFKKHKSNPENLTVEKIKSMMEDMAVLNQKLLKLAASISQKGDSVKALEKSIGDRSSVIRNLESRIHDKEEEINKTKHFNSKEIEFLEAKSRILQACAGLKFIGNHGHLYEFELDPQIGVKVDTTKLDTPQGISCHIKESKYSMLRNLNLVPIFIDLVNSDTTTTPTNVFARLKIIRELWSKVVTIDRESFQINLRHPLKFHVETNGSIEFEFDYLSLGAKTQIKFTVFIPKEKVQEYPVGVSVEARISRSTGDRDKVIQEALADVAGKFSVFSMFSKI